MDAPVPHADSFRHAFEETDEVELAVAVSKNGWVVRFFLRRSPFYDLCLS